MTTAEMTAAPAPMQDGFSARGILAIANAVMAAVVGTLTLGPGAGLIAALVLGLLPLAPYLPQAGRAVVAWGRENPFGVILGAFLLAWIAGTVAWGLAFALMVALPLAPLMLLVIVWITLG